MAWQGSTRSQRLPADWAKRRARVRRRANGQCERVTDGQRCPRAGAECDHIRPGDDHSLSNLQWLCTQCHKDKTTSEATKARRRATASRPRKRPAQKHPGLL